MTFVPPQFTKFGKSASDLLKKSFDFRNEVTSKQSTGNGVTTEVKTGVKGKDLASSVKATYKKNSYDGELSFNTAGDVNAKAVLPFKVHDDLKLTVSGSMKPNGCLDAEFSQDFFASSLSADCCNGTANLKASAAIGADGLSVGTAASATLANGDFAVKDYNFGVNYAEKDFNAALVTKKNGSCVGVSIFQNVSSTQKIAAVYDYDMDKDSSAITLGSSLKLDNATDFKVKVNTSGQVATALSHVVANPNLKVNVSAQFDAKSFSFNADKFGVGLNFGQF